MNRKDIEALRVLATEYGCRSENAMQQCTRAIPALIQTIEELAEALKEVAGPFMDRAMEDALWHDMSDEELVHIRIKYGRFKSIRAALAKLEGGE